MGKQGPCCHCGITTTPLWRNGPPEKPVLCNACGSRWRTKGTLINYTPTHSKELCTNSEEFEIKPKPVKFKNLCNKDEKKKKGGSSGSFRKVLEQESTASSSVSCSSSAKNDLTGSVQSDTWVSLVPSKKRTYVTRPSPTKPSHVVQLTQDLHSILHQDISNSNSSKNSSSLEDDNDLVYKRDTSDEIGYGSVLIRNDKESNLDNVKREKVRNEKLQVMRGQDSALASVNLQDLINHESFVKNLNHEEQQNLFKYLPSIDMNNPPDSLKIMFSSKPFMEALSHFKMLLREGVFGLSISGANGEDCRILNGLVLGNLTRSKWVEFYKQMKDKMTSEFISQISIKRPHDYQNHIYTELKGDKRSPKKLRKSGPAMLPTQEKNCKFTDETPQFFKKQGVSCLIPVPLQYSQDNSENDLLMDVPRNAPSPEAELLYNGPLKVKSLADSSSAFVDSEVTGEDSSSSHTTK